MTLELSRRLLGLSAIELGELDAALLECARTRSSLIAVLMSRRPDLVSTIEDELIDASAPSVLSVRVESSLVARLPPGICEQLFAVPIRLDSRRGQADVAVVDPSDAHVKDEFSFHLGLPIRLVRASIAELSRAIDLLADATARAAATPESDSQELDAGWEDSSGSGDAVTRRHETVRPGPTAVSDAPLPLVKRPRLPAERSTLSRPPGSLWPEAEEPQLAQVVDSDALSMKDDLSSKARHLDARLALVTRSLERADGPDAVVEGLLEGLGLMGSGVVFSVKGSEYLFRAGIRLSAEPAPESFRFQEQELSVLRLAVEGGYYLGPLPDDTRHEGLKDLLPEAARREIYVTSVNVAGRTTLMLLVGGYEGAFTATRHTDELARVAALALDRIVRERKQSKS